MAINRTTSSTAIVARAKNGPRNLKQGQLINTATIDDRHAPTSIPIQGLTPNLIISSVLV
ncbi:hypothetical protein D3C73_1287370 [compost metagenome]